MKNKSIILGICGVGLIIFIGWITLSYAPTIDEYCLEHPNETLYASDGTKSSCLEHLNEIYFNNELIIKGVE